MNKILPNMAYIQQNHKKIYVPALSQAGTIFRFYNNVSCGLLNPLTSSELHRNDSFEQMPIKPIVVGFIGILDLFEKIRD